MEAIDGGVWCRIVSKQKGYCWLRIGCKCSEALDPGKDCMAFAAQNRDWCQQKEKLLLLKDCRCIWTFDR